MNQAETKRFDDFYQRHLRLLKLQGKAEKTIDAYARAVIFCRPGGFTFLEYCQG
jgi:hypothetical protein